MSQSATQKSQYNDLLPPDLYAEVTDQFRDNALEVGGETLEQQQAAREATDEKGKAGAAAFDGSPKPSPHDEFGAVAYHRDPDARSDNTLMVAAGLAVALSSDKQEPEASPAEPAATPEQQRGSFASMRAEQAATVNEAPEPRPEPRKEHDDLMPSNIRAEVENEGRAGQQQAASQAKGEYDDIMPPDIRAGVEAEQGRIQQRQNQAGLTM